MASLNIALATSKHNLNSELIFSTCLPNVYIMAIFLEHINFKSRPLLTFPQMTKRMTSAIMTYQWIRPEVESLRCVF